MDINKNHRNLCVELANLSKDYPDILKFSLEYFSKNEAPWKLIDETTPSSPKRSKILNSAEVDRILESVLIFLQIRSSHFRRSWDWSQFISQFRITDDSYSKWLFCQCIAIVTHMCELKQKRLLSNFFQSNEDILLTSLPYFNKEIVKMFSRPCSFFETLKTEKHSSKLLAITQSIFDFVDIGGIKLPVVGKPDKESSLVLVNSALNNLRGLALAVANGKPVCLCGPVGCGKTALVQHLALVTGHTATNRLYQVQLGEEMDSKLLLGSYKCTDVPGEFIWQPGVLTKAVLGGDWILFEDIDTASSDVITLLVSLIERNALSVPGYRDNIAPAPGFQMFFTQRFISSISGYFQQNSSTTELLRRHWMQLNVEPFTQTELIELIAKKFPVLETISSRMVDVFLLSSVGYHTKDGCQAISATNDVNGSKGRLTSTRDLLKWCARSATGFDVASQETALNLIRNAIDVFCYNISDGEDRLKLAMAITARLGVVEQEAKNYCESYYPLIEPTSESFIAGRVTLRGTPKDSNSNKKLYFAKTQPACCLMEKVACCLSLNEPILLVGETGVGKTSTLQLLAKHTGNTLIVLNMNQQSDSTDLLGGYKPVDVKFIIGNLRNEFETLFRDRFNVEKNMSFLDKISTCYKNKQWTTLIKVMKRIICIAVERLESANDAVKLSQWSSLEEKLERLEMQFKHNRALAFAFVEGALIRALRQGYWVLLDEINLASAETLQCLSGLLEGEGTLSLYEKGEFEPIKRHPQFRLMAAMNPATDVGKKQLPPGIRNRFTEFFVDELTSVNDLITLVAYYFGNLSTNDRLSAIAKFYLKIKKDASISLNDGTGHKPHYSLRTLCRALAIVAANPCGKIGKSLYEGFCLSFLTQLDSKSHDMVEKMIVERIIGTRNIQEILKQEIPEPLPHGNSVCFKGYWVLKGCLEMNVPSNYILTPTVESNLRDLVRVVSLSNHPVLLQGDTSVGKTSLISYLAAASGNKCLRINNHEHTDLQEYIGAYSVDSSSGQLLFKEGVLVEAMRHGYWIILDELNLAPSDVLEALNRVLDDNRELYIPETQTTVTADSRFRLFATQNPPGMYGGRKMLSRAFRNRFIELHFGEIPSLELEKILKERCKLPEKYAKKMVAVMKELQAHRKSSAAFAGKQGFITLRDLFRWGERYRLANPDLEKFSYNWEKHIAEEGYLILAGRVRKIEESEIILQALKKHLSKEINVDHLFTLSDETSVVTKHILEKYTTTKECGFEHIVWTRNLRKLVVLVGKALEFQEPVLMVGETGCGKTTICQLKAAMDKLKLFSVNCHQHSESSDFLGGLRPVRERKKNDSRLFEWVDGPLVKAMKKGEMFLADEISLGDDSVLERLNSLLEPERTLLLTEKTSENSELGELITAHPKFQFLSTMNPGGDYGKKELSPALRNRLTEIWCESCSDRQDLIKIIEHNIKAGLSFGNQEDGSTGIGRAILDFIEWFKNQDVEKKILYSIRDIMLWVKFINTVTYDNEEEMLMGQNSIPKLSLAEAYIHGANLVFLDGLGAGSSSNQERLIKSKKQNALEFLRNQMKDVVCKENDSWTNPKYQVPEKYFGIPPFYIEKGEVSVDEHFIDSNFTFQAKTTKGNLLRLLRSLQLPGRAILLEGSPGVGKTSLVQALAKAAGHKLTRINLSEQTDVSDLFGADLPVDGADGGVFAWRDGPFLKALKDGNWILLDELNLASQSVLEGLNAVLDHRGKLSIPELGKSFAINSTKTRLFACQNPLRQGGARKGLPASFLNRFTQVYMETLDEEDVSFIIQSLHPRIPSDVVQLMVNFNTCLAKECGIKWGLRGAPWEMNLRDLMRWCEVMEKYSNDGGVDPGRYVSLIYADRMRTVEDKQRVLSTYESIFGERFPYLKTTLPFSVTPKEVTLGDITLLRSKEDQIAQIIDSSNPKLVLRSQMNTLRSLAICLEMNWFVILVGNSGSGKTSVVHVISQLCNKKLEVLSVNSAMDTMEILGGFEQVDYNRHFEEISSQVEKVFFIILQKLILRNDSWNEVADLFDYWKNFKSIGDTEEADRKKSSTLTIETELFKKRITTLFKLLKYIEKLEYFTNEIEEILKKLKKLESDVEKIGSLNSGGKFEWVDSLLIKCMTEGRWLLVENVNLCSPAVLDRLNGLLEPGGTLILGEKGVDQDGNLVSVTPHPDFRLFFTMDPQRGDISRAMRNRGVEISMQSIDEDLSGQNVIDLMAAMHHNGVISHSVISAFLQMHFAIRQLNIGLDHLSVGHMMRACFLFVQHHRRHGKSVEDTLKIVCEDVYLKSRSLSYNQQEIVFNTISEVLNSREIISELRPFYLTTNTQNLQFDSTFYMVEQQSALMLLLDQIVAEKLSTNLSELLFGKLPISDEFRKTFDITGINVDNLLLYSVLKFYDETTVYDLKYRHFWIERLTGRNDLTALSENLSSVVASGFKIASNTSPDLQRTTVFRGLVDGTVNRISLLMNYLALKHRCLELDCCYSFGTEEMDVNLRQYSKACIKGNVPVENITEELIASQFDILDTKMNDFFVYILNNESVLVDEQLYTTFLRTLQHYNKFAKIGDLPFFSSSSLRVNRQPLSYLRIQFKWLMKWIRKLTVQIESRFDTLSQANQVRALFESVAQIEASSDFTFAALLSFSKQLKTKMGQPDVNDFETEKIEIDDWYCSNRSKIDDKKIRALLYGGSTEPKTEISEALDAKIEAMEEDETILENENKVSESPIFQDSEHPVDIVPIFEALYLRIETNCKNHICGRYVAQKNDVSAFETNVALRMLPYVEKLPFISPTYVSNIRNSLVENISENGLPMKRFCLFLKHVQSFATFSYANFLKYREARRGTDEAEDSTGNEDLLPFHYPTVATFGNEFMFLFNEHACLPRAYTPSMRNLQIYKVTMNQLNEFLWKNSSYISHPGTSYLCNELQSIRHQYDYIISCLRDIFDLNDNHPCSKELIDEIMQHLKDRVKNKKIIENEIAPKELKLINEISKNIEEVHALLKDTSDSNETWLIIGKSWKCLGVAQFLLYSIFDLVDPVHKVKFKKLNFEDDLEYVRCRLVLEKISHVLLGYNTGFPYEELYEKWQNEVGKKIETFPADVIMRDEAEKYYNIVKDIAQFKNSIGSLSSIDKIYSKIVDCIESLDGFDFNKEAIASAYMSIRMGKVWLDSVEQFLNSINEKYPEYADVITPITFAVHQVTYGIRILSSLLSKKISIGRSVTVLQSRDAYVVQNICSNLCSFPRSNLSKVHDFVAVCLSDDVVQLLAYYKSEKCNSTNITMKLTSSCLKEFCCVLSVIDNTDNKIKREIWTNVGVLLNRVVTLWKAQEEKRQETQQQEESLYLFKTRTLCETVSEEEENKIEIRRFFAPSYNEDFDTEPSLDEKEISKESKPPETLLTDDDLTEICSIHSELSKQFTCTRWSHPKTVLDTRSFILDSFYDRYCVFAEVLKNYHSALDEIMDSISLPGAVLATCKAQKFSSCVEEFQDFYHNCDVNEVYSFYPILNNVKEHTETLLKSWEDNPVLLKIMETVERIMSFEVTSPVSRFLTGADVLLQKLHEWEEVAHQGVSFTKIYEDLTGLIFKWRKMEISYWKNALENVACRMKKKTSKWWFLLYSVCCQYLEESDNQCSFEALVSALQKFIETATLGEFDAKLSLLFVFHCHYANQGNTARLRSLRNVLWNLHSYYKQFQAQISAHIQKVSVDVRKNLHNFVKITRWNDINYWSIMKTVEKTHQQLMKYIKKFQTILESPIQSGMHHIPDTEKSVSLVVDKVSFVLSDHPPLEYKRRSKKFVTKSKELCKKIILTSKYETLTKSMKDFTDSIHEDVEIINRMDIDRTLEKEKQRSQAKHLLQQKKRTMVDLLHNLKTLGISYRTGIYKSAKRNFSVEFTILKPIDIALSYSSFTNNAADKTLINAWNGCEENFLCSVSKQSQLNKALEKPHQDILADPTTNFNTLKGFTARLLEIAFEQKEKLIEYSDNLFNLKVLESILPELCQENCILGRENVIGLKEKFICTVNEVTYFLHQFLVILDCCPSTNSASVPFIKLKDNDSPMLYSTKSSSLWNEIRDKVETNLTKLESLRNQFFFKVISTPNSSKVYEAIITNHQYEIMMNCRTDFENLLQVFNLVKSSFCYQEYDKCNSLIGGIQDAECMVTDLLNAIDDFKIPHANSESDISTCERKSKRLRKKIQLSEEKIYKKHCNEEKRDICTDSIIENHLTNELMESLDEDVSILDVKNVSKRVLDLINLLLKSDFDCSSKKRMLEPLCQLLNQYVLLAEFTVTQYVSMFKLTTKLCSNLLNLFTDLAVKGYCIPTELLEEEEKDDKTPQDKNGMGLEDGEGIKDVSDEIESQDQLEGAQQAGQEEKKDDKDCKEEEKGVEMSDDFGGRSQELEKKDEDDDSDSGDEDEDELDKEMGETGEEAETLDQQIWGSDSESEEEEEGEGKESNEHDDRGEETGSKELGAKDERTKETEERKNDDKEQNEKEQQKEINEMDEKQEDEDHIDPYHGHQEPPPEPEPFDLPDNLQIDEEGKDDDGEDEENPFDIDNMKEQKVSEEQSEETEEQSDEKNEETKEPELDNENDDDNVGTKKDDEKIDESAGEENNEAEKEEEKSDGGAKDEDKVGDEPKPEEIPEKDDDEAAQPSEETSSENPAQAAKNDETGSKDMVSKLPDENDQKPEEEKQQDTTGVEQQGVGKADEAEKNTKEGHSSEQNEGSESREKGSREQKRKLKPGESDMNRSLAEANESSRKRLKTVDLRENQQKKEEEEEEEAMDESEGTNNESDLYQHIKESETGTAETIDAATKEQAEQQPIVDEKGGEELNDDEDVEMHESEEECNNDDDIKEQNPDKIKSSKRDNKRNDMDGEVVEDQTRADEVNVEGDFIETMTVERGYDTTFHTQENKDEENQHELTIEYLESLKNKVQEQLGAWNQTPDLEEASSAWEMFSAITANLSQELSEQLRLVLEPSLASRLKGDFRTGRRINMRKVIPYIASQFRKDKIWLRRTKPSKREYQIILAIDDSSSMSDNHSKELAFESVALVSKALNLIEAGELGVISFGERTRILHPLGEPFTTQTGAKLVRDFTFDEVKTKIADAIHAANGIFLTRGSTNHAVKSAQLLVILSDGRGVTSEGVSTVESAIRTAKQAGIFIVFIIIDNPNAKDSIWGIQRATFRGNKLMEISSYLDDFPFPFYLILRDINKLPGVLSDALRQWFELVISSSD